MRRACLSVLVVAPALAAFAAAGSARADEPSRFGDRRQIVLTADRLMPLFGWSSQTITANDGAVTTETTDRGASFAFFVGKEPGLGIIHTVPRVALDFAVWRHFTLGASFIAAFGLANAHVEERSVPGEPHTTRETSPAAATLFGFAPRIGYVIPFGEHLALWGRVGFAFYSVSSSTDQKSNAGITTASKETDTVFSLDLDPQLVWSPAAHFLVHLGPLVDVPLGGTHETAFNQTGVSQTRSDDPLRVPRGRERRARRLLRPVTAHRSNDGDGEPQPGSPTLVGFGEPAHAHVVETFELARDLRAHCRAERARSQGRGPRRMPTPEPPRSPKKGPLRHARGHSRCVRGPCSIGRRSARKMKEFRLGEVARGSPDGDTIFDTAPGGTWVGP